MKRLLLVLCLILTRALPAHAAIAVVNHATAQGAMPGSDATTTAGSFTGSTVLYVCTVGFYAAPTPTDSSSNTYTLISSQGSTTTTHYSACFYSATPTVTSSMTFTATGSTDYYVAIAAIGFSGTSATPLDAHNSGGGTSITSIQPGNATVATGEVTVTFAGLYLTSSSTSVNSGFTLTDNLTDLGGGQGMALAYHLSASSPSDPTWSLGSSVQSAQAHIVTFMASGGSGGSGYYVATTGNDGNAGSIGSPFLTISKGVSVLSAGSTLWIRAGTYSGGINTIDAQTYTVPGGTSVSPITIAAYGCGAQPAGEWYGPAPGCEVVTMQPPDMVSAIRLISSTQVYLVIQDLVIDGTNQATGGDLVQLSGGASHNTFTRVEVKNAFEFGVVTSLNNGAAIFEQFLHCHVHGNGSPSGALTNGHGLYLDTSDNTVTGCSIHDNQGEGLQVNASDGKSTTTSRTTITQNRIYNNGARSSTSASNITVANGDSQFIANNLVYSDGRSNLNGIQVYSYSTNALVYNNVVYGHGNDGIALQYYSSAPVITNNLVYNNTTPIHDLGGLSGTPVLTTNLTTNPNYVNPSGSPPNFKLQVGSTAIWAGTHLTAVPTDFSGLPYHNPPSVGAYEASTSTSPATLMTLGVR